METISKLRMKFRYREEWHETIVTLETVWNPSKS